MPLYYESPLVIVFLIISLLALTVDMFFLIKREKKIKINSAIIQTLLFVLLAIIYGIFIYFFYLKNFNKSIALKSFSEYLSAYLMEYALSMDNVFVFVLIFSFFKIKDLYIPRVLFWGIILAIIFRLFFIITGIWIVSKFHWILYLFGIILVYTGINIFRQDEQKNASPDQNWVYKFLIKNLRFTNQVSKGRFFLRIDSKLYLTTAALVVFLLATSDILFAMDSIPAVFAISQNKIIIITSNIFAVLGLRALFFVLKSAVHSFKYLPKGIAFILVFIGLKMFMDFFKIEISALISLVIIVTIFVISICLSLLSFDKKG